MSNKSSKDSRKGSFFAGFVMGGLAGAAIALIFAPQSGVNTRGQATDFALKRTEGATAPVTNGFSSNGHQPHVDATDSDEQPRIILDKGTTPTSDEDKSST